VRALFTSIRFKQVGHFHDFGPDDVDGGFVGCTPLFAAFFGRT
jgi:hypothetical protein